MNPCSVFLVAMQTKPRQQGHGHDRGSTGCAGHQPIDTVHKPMIRMVPRRACHHSGPTHRYVTRSQLTAQCHWINPPLPPPGTLLIYIKM